MWNSTMGQSLISSKTKNMIIKYPEFPIEWAITYQYGKSQIGEKSPDNSQPEGSKTGFGRLYTAVWRIFPRAKCIGLSAKLRKSTKFGR